MGDFKEGKPSGFGQRYFDYDGVYMAYEGEFREGEYCGLGWMYNSEDQLVYEGEFNDGQISGFGTQYESGSTFEGTFSH